MKRRALDVAVIGGGLSGLSTAVRAASRGARVALFEASPKLGGRSYSYTDARTGEEVDNGQHVLLGAYRNLLAYLEMIGTRHLLREERALRLPLFHPQKGRGCFEVSPLLPRPLHITWGMLRFNLLTFTERLRLLAVGNDLALPGGARDKELALMTVSRWLESLRQSEEAVASFWNPIAVSVMNDSPERVSALVFARALRAAFSGAPSDSAMLLPRVGQTELYVRGAERFLKEKGGTILTGVEVSHILARGGSATGIRLADGTSVEAGAVVSTVPYFALQSIIPLELKTERPFRDLWGFESSPIISLQLHFDRDFMDEAYLGLIGMTLQWVFNRRKIMGREAEPGGIIAATISGARSLVDLPKEELVSRAVLDLLTVFPESRNARLLHSVVIKEKRATFSPTCAAEPLRPGTRTPLEGFFLAGDWTDTGLPATIEGAVMSGLRAADLLS